MLGLVAMIAGAARPRRDVWFAGAVLMGFVVTKLFLIDLGNSGTLARVFSFIGVGLRPTWHVDLTTVPPGGPATASDST